MNGKSGGIVMMMAGVVMIKLRITMMRVRIKMTPMMTMIMTNIFTGLSCN